MITLVVDPLLKIKKEIRPSVDEKKLDNLSKERIYLIDLIESVQRKFTKIILSLSKLSYIQKLNNFGLDSLELRLLRFDIINYFKILKDGGA